MKVLTDANEAFRLDAKDKKILQIYSENCRIPLSSLAKQVQLSRASVSYRLDQLKKREIITGHKSIINIKELGYKSYHVFLTIFNRESEKNILKKAQESNGVNAIIRYRGTYTLELSFMAQNFEEFLELYTKLIADVKILKEETTILGRNIISRVLPESFFKEQLNTSQKTQKKEVYEVDELDLKLLYTLSEDSSKNSMELARDLNTSRDTISYRMKKLEKATYILEYRPAINYYQLGLSIHTLLIKIDKARYAQSKDFEQFLKREDEVIWATQAFGSYDYIIYILSSKIEEFHEFFEKTKEHFGAFIINYELLFAYKEEKYSYMSEYILEKKQQSL